LSEGLDSVVDSLNHATRDTVKVIVQELVAVYIRVLEILLTSLMPEFSA